MFDWTRLCFLNNSRSFWYTLPQWTFVSCCHLLSLHCRSWTPGNGAFIIASLLMFTRCFDISSKGWEAKVEEACQRPPTFPPPPQCKAPLECWDVEIGRAAVGHQYGILPYLQNREEDFRKLQHRLLLWNSYSLISDWWQTFQPIRHTLHKSAIMLKKTPIQSAAAFDGCGTCLRNKPLLERHVYTPPTHTHVRCT